MCGEQAKGELGVAGERGIHDGLMLIIHVASAGREGDRQPPIALALRIKKRVKMEKPGAAASIDKREMKGRVSNRPIFIGTRRIDGVALGRASETMRSGDEAGFPLHVPIRDGVTKAEA